MAASRVVHYIVVLNFWVYFFGNQDDICTPNLIGPGE
jgi:hypothetical protein